MDDVATLQIPVIPGDSVPWVEPRRVGPDGPVWDATDEIFITYDKECNRVLTTTGQANIFAEEHDYQRTGAAKYESLRDLDPGRSQRGYRLRFGDRVAEAVGPIRNAIRVPWADVVAGEYPQVHDGRDGDDAGAGPASGARSHSPQPGDGSDGTSRHARDRADRAGVPERPSGAEQRVRSHRHCAGCTGHARYNSDSGRGFAVRILIAWGLGLIATVLGRFPIDLGQYCVLTAFVPAIAILLRPVWRALVDAGEVRTKGGRR